MTAENPSRRQVETFPALDEAILIMGMPPGPFLLATLAAGLAPVLGGFHAITWIPALLYPSFLAALRRLGRQDPQRFRVLLEHALFYRRFYHPVGYVAAPTGRHIRRRSLLP